MYIFVRQKATIQIANNIQKNGFGVRGCSAYIQVVRHAKRDTVKIDRPNKNQIK